MILLGSRKERFKIIIGFTGIFLFLEFFIEIIQLGERERVVVRVKSIILQSLTFIVNLINFKHNPFLTPYHSSF